MEKNDPLFQQQKSIAHETMEKEEKHSDYDGWRESQYLWTMKWIEIEKTRTIANGNQTENWHFCLLLVFNGKTKKMEESRGKIPEKKKENNTGSSLSDETESKR